MSEVDLAEVALAEGNFEQAHHWLALSFEYVNINIRRLLTSLCAMAGFIILSPDRQKKDLVKAAQIYGAIESISEKSGIILGTFYQEKKSERITKALKRLPAREWDRALQAGQLLSRDEVIELIRALLNPSS
jgi:hypothetical protein